MKLTKKETFELISNILSGLSDDLVKHNYDTVESLDIIINYTNSRIERIVELKNTLVDNDSMKNTKYETFNSYADARDKLGFYTIFITACGLKDYDSDEIDRVIIVNNEFIWIILDN